VRELNNHQLKAGGFKLGAESTDTGRKTRRITFIMRSLAVDSRNPVSFESVVINGDR